MGLRVIVFMGMGTLLFLALVAFGLKRSFTPQEHTLDKVCAASLRAVGDVIYHALPVIEGRLDSIGARTDGN